MCNQIENCCFFQQPSASLLCGCRISAPWFLVLPPVSSCRSCLQCSKFGYAWPVNPEELERRRHKQPTVSYSCHSMPSPLESYLPVWLLDRYMSDVDDELNCHVCGINSFTVDEMCILKMSLAALVELLDAFPVKVRGIQQHPLISSSHIQDDSSYPHFSPTVGRKHGGQHRWPLKPPTHQRTPTTVL